MAIKVSWEPGYDRLPRLQRNNTDKWRSGLRPDQIREIAPVLTPTLRRAGYVDGGDWADRGAEERRRTS